MLNEFNGSATNAKSQAIAETQPLFKVIKEM